MSFFLLWKNKHQEFPVRKSQVESTLNNLKQIYSSYFTNSFSPEIVFGDEYNLIIWIPKDSSLTKKLREENENYVAYSINYPANICELTSSNHPLLELSKMLEKDPHNSIGKIMSIFSMFWKNKVTGESTLQVDGLGSSPVYEFNDDSISIYTNKIFALKALGLTLKIDYNEWAFKFCYKFMPNQSTGFKGVRRLSPGERITFTKGKIKKTIFNILNDFYFKDEKLSIQDCLELAYSSLLGAMKSLSELTINPLKQPLTGGFDTRVCASLLYKLNKPVNFYIIGDPNELDIQLAKLLVGKIGYPLSIQDSRDVIPLPNIQELKANTKKSLIWRDCLEDVYQLKYMSYWYEQRGVESSVLGSGKSGELGRFRKTRNKKFISKPNIGLHYQRERKEYFHEARRILSDKFEYEPNFVNLKSHVNNHVVDYIQSTYKQIISESLENGNTIHQHGFHQYLMNDERNFRTGTFVRGFNIKRSPFLHPNFLKASYNIAKYPVDDFDLIPRYVSRKACPAWNDIPYVMDSVSKDNYLYLKENSGFNNKEFWKQVSNTELDKLYSLTSDIFFNKEIKSANHLICDLILTVNSLEELVQS